MLRGRYVGCTIKTLRRKVAIWQLIHVFKFRKINNVMPVFTKITSHGFLFLWIIWIEKKNKSYFSL